MKSKVRLFSGSLCAATIALAAPAGAEWTLVTTGSTGVRNYADPTRYSRAGDVVTVNEFADYSQSRGNAGISRQITTKQYDCFRRTTRTLKLEGYFTGSNTPTFSNTPNAAFDAVNAGSVGEAMMEWYCKRPARR